MKIVTVLGTRPEIIRLSRLIPLLDKYCTHVLVHTGQNYDPNLNDIFFRDFRLRAPDVALECRAPTAMEQVGKILSGCERVFTKEKPDRVLILGDTNSALCAIAAKRMGIPVYHMEAGNRCFDDRVPEEVNRRIIDHSSDILMPYTERSRANLLREGIPGERIFVTGNPILEVLEYHKTKIAQSRILQKLKLKRKNYFLVTLHRAENVDIPERLENFTTAFLKIAAVYKAPVICSLHPRTRKRLDEAGKQLRGTPVRAIDPPGLFDFVNLEKNAFCVLSDSGTVQEECCLFGVPNVTIRDVTERPETVESGSNIIGGSDPGTILDCIKVAVNGKKQWAPPAEYLAKNVSGTVLKILMGYSR